jgi:exonuclease 3'-5' domain-containing protein 1
MFVGLNDENKRGLKHVLENKKIIKLVHDCRNDWDSLLHQYSVRIFNFIDTQEAYFIFKLFYYQDITLPISLLRFIEFMINQKLTYKDKFKGEMLENELFWSERPLSDERLLYASQDVVYLYKAWNSIELIFNDNLKEIVNILFKNLRSLFHQFSRS